MGGHVSNEEASDAAAPDLEGEEIAEEVGEFVQPSASALQGLVVPLGTRKALVIGPIHPSSFLRNSAFSRTVTQMAGTVGTTACFADGIAGAVNGASPTLAFPNFPSTAGTLGAYSHWSQPL